MNRQRRIIAVEKIPRNLVICSAIWARKMEDLF